MGSNATIYKGSVHCQSTAIIAAKMVKLTGAAYNQSEISAISYSITDMGTSQYDTPAAVTGHANVSLLVSDVFFDPEIRTYNGEQRTVNFEFQPDKSTNQPFPTAGHTYRVRIEFTPTVGVCTPLVVDMKAI